MLPGHAEKAGQPGSHSDEDGVVPVEQVVDRLGPADGSVQLEHHPLIPQLVDLGRHHLLGEPVFGDAVDEDAARFVQGLVDRHGVAPTGQVAGARQPGGTAPHHRHRSSRRGDGGGLRRRARLPGAVGHEALEVTDGDRSLLAGEDAGALALALLGAYPTAHRGEGVVLQDHRRRPGEVALGHGQDELVDAHPHRTSLDAAGMRALQAADGLEHRQLVGEPEVDLVEGPGPFACRPLRHRRSGERHPVLAAHPLHSPPPRVAACSASKAR